MATFLLKYNKIKGVLNKVKFESALKRKTIENSPRKFLRWILATDSFKTWLRKNNCCYKLSN